MLRIPKMIGSLLLLALLYGLVAPIVGMALLFVAHYLAMGLEWALKWLALASPPLLGVLVGHEAARRAGGGLLVGMAVGLATVGLWFGISEDLRALGAGHTGYTPLVYAVATILACSFGGYWYARRANRRASHGPECPPPEG